MEGLSAICAGLGAIEEDENDNRIGYEVGEYCSDNLKDLLRFLRRDDPQTREVFKQVCKWNIVGKDLLPIIEHCQDDRNLILNAVKILVFLTMPVEPSSTDIPQQMEYLWGIKRSITFSEAVPVIMSLLESPLENLECESFTEDDWKLVQLVITLFRNILAIQDISPNQKAGGSTSQFMFLRDKFLELLFQENVMDVILVLSQHVGGSCRHLRHDNLLLLETFYYIFMGQEPEFIAKAYMKCSKVDEDAETSLNSLKEIMEEEREKRKIIRQRNLGCYSQFSGTFTRFSLDGSKTLLKGNPSVSHDALLKVNKNHRGPMKRTVWDHGRLPSTKNKILELLYGFMNQFLEGGYNVLIESVREDIDKEHHTVQNSDVLIFIHVAQFVVSFQYHKFLNKPNIGVHTESSVDCHTDSTLVRGSICGPIAESLNESMFQLVTQKWRYAFDTLKESNDYKFLSVAGSFMRTMLLMLDLVLEQSPENSKENKTTRILLYKLFYDQTDEGMTLFILNQIKSFDTHKQAKSYLTDLLETMSILLQLMEKLQACGVLRVSKKQRKKHRKKPMMDGKKDNDDKAFQDTTTIQNDQGGSGSERTIHLDASIQEGNSIPTQLDESMVLGEKKTKMDDYDETVGNSNTIRNDVDGFSNEKPMNIDAVHANDEPSARLSSPGSHVPEMEQKITDETCHDSNNGMNDYSGEEDVMTSEVDLNVSALVSALANNDIVQNLCWLLKFYKSNSVITNNFIIRMLQRICDDLELSPMLYQLSLLTIFYNILEEQKLRPCKEYENVVIFLTSLVRRMLRKMKNYPLLFIEVLFWKTRKECCYINCESMLNELSGLKRSTENWSSASDRQGWVHRSIADALGDDEADFVLSNRDSTGDKAWGVECSNENLGQEEHNSQSISDVELCATENFDKEEHFVEKETEREPKRRKLSVLGYELKAKVKELYEKYKDDQHCDRLIAEALDPDGKVSPLQVSKALKHLGFKMPRRRRTANTSVDAAGVSDATTHPNLTVMEKESSVRRPTNTRKRVRAFSEEQEQKIKDLFEQFKGEKRCNQMIADALDPDGTFTAAKVSRKLKQLGLYLPKKKKSASNLQLRDEAFSDGSDDETLLSMRIRSQKQLNEERQEQSTRISSHSQDESDDELLSNVLVKTRKKNKEKLMINSTEEDFTEKHTDMPSSRGEDEETAEMEAAGADFISPNRSGDELSSEKEWPQRLEVEVEEKLDELADYENDEDAPLLASSNKNTGSRRQLRMVIDMDEEDE
ncbi:interaptin [Ipomoea triloba]|uniref:interaptin n=1 Tax=Ipomoea triloba TaxID=35885 RepID=UPI00125E608D|nr:interaptin [Ipomoea triloba]